MIKRYEFSPTKPIQIPRKRENVPGQKNGINEGGGMGTVTIVRGSLVSQHTSSTGAEMNNP